MSSEPLVSVIISAYNVEGFVQEAINSILQQDYKNLELLIADDMSRDRTRALIDQFDDPRIRFYHNDQNVGYLQTWNKLLPLTKGRYVTFQDGDDVSHPQRLSKLVVFLETHPDISLCGSNFVRFFKPWGLYTQSNFPLLQNDIEKAIQQGNIPFAGTRVMIRRDVYERVGGFRDFFHGLTWEDYDWILRIMEKFKVANISDVLYEYRYFRRSTSKQSLQSTIEKLYVDKIGFFLAKQRKEFGKDALQMNQMEQIQEFLTDFKKSEVADVTQYRRYSRVMSNVVANKDFKSAWLLWSGRLISYPFDLRNIRIALVIFLAFVRTIGKSIIFRLSGKSKDSILDF